MVKTATLPASVRVRKVVVVPAVVSAVLVAAAVANPEVSHLIFIVHFVFVLHC